MREPRKVRIPETERLSVALRCYVTQGERDAVDVAAPQYDGSSNLLRRALAEFLRRHHPELLKHLRKDLKVLDTSLGAA